MDQDHTVSLFWRLQLVAWPAYGIVSTVGALPYVGLVPHLDSLHSVLVGKAVFSAAGLVASAGLRIVYRRVAAQSGAWTRIAPLVILLSYVAGLSATLCANAARYLISGRYLDTVWSSFFGGAVNASAIFLAWSACYFAVRNYQALETEKSEALKANALAQQAQFEMLRSQVSPCISCKANDFKINRSRVPWRSGVCSCAMCHAPIDVLYKPYVSSRPIECQ